MITNDILYQIYQKNLSREIITASYLTSLGLNYNDINKLLNEGILKRIERGKYGLSSFDDLYNYGIYLTQKELYPKAESIFKQCLILNPNHQETYLYLLYISIKRKHYSKSFEQLDKLSDLKVKPTKINLFLYLLCNVNIAYPKRYNQKIKNLQLKDIYLPSKNKDSRLLQTLSNVNAIINDINTRSKKNNSFSPIEELILKELTDEIRKKEVALYQKILKLAENEQYSDIIYILENRNKKLSISNYYQNVLIISQKIVSFLETGKIPTKTKNGKLVINSAISNNDFEKAVSLNNYFLTKTGISKEDDILSILLNKINDLTSPIIYNQKLNRIFHEEPRNKTIENILIELFQNKLESAIDLLSSYLKEIGKEEYIYLITSLIKISLSECDDLFQRPATVLQELSNDEYVYNISFYLQDFYFYLFQNKTGTAKLYLDIIKKYSQESTTIINNLENDLTNGIEKAKIESSQDRELLLKKLREMKANKESIIILEPIPHFRRKTIYEILRSIPELVGFSIGNEPKTLVLRYINPSLKKVNYQNKPKEATTLYHQGKYQESININLQLLSYPHYNPYYKNYAYVYAQLGLSYLNLKNTSEAIKYLTIATSLNREDPNGLAAYDFTDLISQIQNSQIETDEDIDNVIITSTEFRDDTNNTYGITEIEEIASYINIENLSIEDACRKFNLTDEQIQLVKLIYVREYYTEGLYQIGDKLLLEVSKNKNNTKKVRDVLEELRKNKLFYKNRNNTHTKRLIP